MAGTAGGRHFEYSHDFDENGILHFIGTESGTRAWTNPANKAGTGVVVTSSGVEGGSPENFIGRVDTHNYTRYSHNEWIQVELPVALLVDRYTIKHGYSYTGKSLGCLRSWNLEGSNDGVTFTMLREHVDDRSLNGGHATFTWAVNPGKIAYTHFRLRMTGPNSGEFGNWFMVVCGLEFYGAIGATELRLLPQALPERGFDHAAASAALVAGRRFTYASDFDEHGVIYWIGTAGRTRGWTNPANQPGSGVRVTSSPMRSGTVENFVARTADTNCTTGLSDDEWIMVEFPAPLVLERYTIRHGYITAQPYSSGSLRNWRLEGSNDGQAFTLLREHENDESLNSGYATSTWIIEPPSTGSSAPTPLMSPAVSPAGSRASSPGPGPSSALGLGGLVPMAVAPRSRSFKMFRLRMTGPNSGKQGLRIMAVSGLEFYGCFNADLAELSSQPLPLSARATLKGTLRAHKQRVALLERAQQAAEADEDIKIANLQNKLIAALRRKDERMAALGTWLASSRAAVQDATVAMATFRARVAANGIDGLGVSEVFELLQQLAWPISMPVLVANHVTGAKLAAQSEDGLHTVLGKTMARLGDRRRLFNSLRCIKVRKMFVPDYGSITLDKAVPSTWDVAQVCSWLDNEGFGFDTEGLCTYSVAFRAQAINGAVLLGLGGADLDRLGVAPEDKGSVMRKIKELNALPATAGAARSGSLANPMRHGAVSVAAVPVVSASTAAEAVEVAAAGVGEVRRAQDQARNGDDKKRRRIQTM